MTPSQFEKFKKLFPKAHPDVLKLNSPTQGAGPTAIVEHHPRDGALAARPVQAVHPGRYLVSVTSVRGRLLDEDNLCEKYAIDALRYAGIIPSDAPDKTRITATQRKAQEGEEEHTLIEVFEIP